MNTEELFLDANDLPKPLSKDELSELFDKIKLGDEEAKNKVIEHNIRLVLYEVTKKFRTVNYDKKDLISIGNVGLIKAVLTFDKSRNMEFATYTVKCIDNEILQFLRKLKKLQNIDSLDRTISKASYKEGYVTTLGDITPSKNDMIEEFDRKESYQIIREIINNLPAQDREIIMLYFGFYNNKLYTQAEIAERTSLAQSWVSRLIKKIVKKMELQLKQDYNYSGIPDNVLSKSKIKVMIMTKNKMNIK